MFINSVSCNNINKSSSSSMFPLYTDPSTVLLKTNNNNTANTSSSSTKRKRRPAGTPDPEAEVVSLSPRTLLESDRYVCEICNQGFQRDQNLQMHRRRHKVPWKLLKRDHDNRPPSGGGVRKRVFVCPEPTCLHHDPCHALGDLVGIKKHFRRKHSTHKQWACHKCSKAYAVHSDFKAHLKTCGTRGHCCDCGRVFSRVESFIEHQDTCHMGRLLPNHRRHHLIDAGQHDHQAPITSQQQQPPPEPVCLSTRTASSNSNFNPAADDVLPRSMPTAIANPIIKHDKSNTNYNTTINVDLELQLSIGSSDTSDKNESSVDEELGKGAMAEEEGGSGGKVLINIVEDEMLKSAMAEKAYAEEARMEAKREVEVAESEFASAKRMRQQAKAELERAQGMMEAAVKRISCTLIQITCHACKQQQQLQAYHQINGFST